MTIRPSYNFFSLIATIPLKMLFEIATLYLVMLLLPRKWDCQMSILFNWIFFSCNCVLQCEFLSCTDFISNL